MGSRYKKKASLTAKLQQIKVFADAPITEVAVPVRRKAVFRMACRRREVWIRSQAVILKRNESKTQTTSTECSRKGHPVQRTDTCVCLQATSHVCALTSCCRIVMLEIPTLFLPQFFIPRLCYCVIRD